MNNDLNTTVLIPFGFSKASYPEPVGSYYRRASSAQMEVVLAPSEW